MNELLLASALRPEQRQWAETVQASGRHLMAVINDILDFSRIESGRMVLEHVDFDLNAVVKDVMAMVDQPAKAKGLQLSARFTPADPVLALRGDPFRLRQVIMNLLGNAVKFTDSGSVRIDVTTQRLATGAVAVSIRVQDSGIGITPEAQKRIFENFSQGDGSTTRKYGGSGLGLAICKRLLEQMGGSISVDSVPGRGSAFQVDLNLPPADGPVIAQSRAYDGSSDPVGQAAPAPAPEPAPGLRLGPLCGKLLLVEDNPVNQAVGVAMLRRLGVECVLAADGAQAVQRVREAVFDIVLMDCQMPVMDGFEATAQIRRLPGRRGEQLPIVALTANTMPDDEQRCLAAGMDAFLAKPYTLATLHAMVSRWLESSSPVPVKPVNVDVV
jgi:CheY-like chemotaxis protein